MDLNHARLPIPPLRLSARRGIVKWKGEAGKGRAETGNSIVSREAVAERGLTRDSKRSATASRLTGVWHGFLVAWQVGVDLDGPRVDAAG
jgi:hypothetical protein